MPTQSKWQSLPTEQINPASLAVDKTPVRDILDMVINEDRKVIAAVQKRRRRSRTASKSSGSRSARGGVDLHRGRTCGRLAWWKRGDAANLGTRPGGAGHHGRRAGGGLPAKEGSRTTMRKAGEASGASASRTATSSSACQPAASRRCRGADARPQGGREDLFVTCWPGSELQNFVDLIIAPSVGPEIIAGPRASSGARPTKMVLNMLTTVAMIKWGRLTQPDVDVRTGSEKLKDRAKRILGIVTGLEPEAAGRCQAGEVEPEGRHRHGKAGLTLPQAMKRLRKADNSVREAIGEDIEPRLRELLGISREVHS